MTERTPLGCGFDDVVWKDNKWQCGKCKKLMPPNYEIIVKNTCPAKTYAAFMKKRA